MKKFFLFCLSLHVLVEGLVGLILVIAPRTFLPDAPLTEIALAINQGFVALTMVLAVVWFWPYRRNAAALAVTLALLTTFHGAISVASIYTATMGNDPSNYVLHWVFTACFGWLWLKRNQLLEPAVAEQSGLV